MANRGDQPLLSELDPKAVAEEVCGWVLDRANRLLFALGESASAHHLQQSDLGLSVRELVLYAQEGAPHCADATPGDYVQTVVEALYTAAHPGVYPTVEGDWSSNEEPEHAIDVVIRAALARERLSSRGSTPIGWLAPLGGCSVKRLRNLGALGEIKISDNEVPNAEARRWLESRGVKGLT